MHSFLRNSNSFIIKNTTLRRSCVCQKKVHLSDTLKNRLEIYKFPSTVTVISTQYQTFLRSIHNASTYSDDTLLQTKIVSNNSLVPIRNFSMSIVRFEKEPLKPSSKVEAAVQDIKDKQKEKEALPAKPPPKAVAKKSIKQKIVDELVHYYHGFRLLFIDIKISSMLCWRVLMGKTLTRRERRLLVRTVGDMFRLVPFSVFVIVPFMEFTLPFFIKFFPGMLPSTFETATEKEDKMKQALKVKLEMAKFLQQTLDDMSVQHKDHHSDKAKEFADWFKKVRTSGEIVSNDEIMKYSKLFQDEITLDSLTRGQLVALCRVLEVRTIGTGNFLRFQLRMKLRSLAADDKMIQKEGVESLTLSELQQACRARGMRAFGLSTENLRRQLDQWLDLSLNKKVPPSLLLLSRALTLPETTPTSDVLKATISSLPETIVKQTSEAIADREGKIDPKVKIEVLKDEVCKIKEERKEKYEEKKRQEQICQSDVLVDKAPNLSVNATPALRDAAKTIQTAGEALDEVTKKKEMALSTEDCEALECALDALGKEKKKVMVEKEEIEGLKEEMADYQEDLKELQEITLTDAACKETVKESKAAKRLFKKVNNMISKMDCVLQELEKEEKQLKKDLQEQKSQVKADELVRIDDLMEAIKKIKNVPDESRLSHIQTILAKIDDDRDGSIKVEDVLKVIEAIGEEDVHLSRKQVDELIELLDKEEILEVEDKIEKALEKERVTKEKGSNATEADSKSEVEACLSKCDKSGKSDNDPSSGPSKLAQSHKVPPLSSTDKNDKPKHF